MTTLGIKSPESEWRCELGRRVGETYACNAEVRAVVVGGSAGFGYADEFSDVEVLIFWDSEPSAAGGAYQTGEPSVSAATTGRSL